MAPADAVRDLVSAASRSVEYKYGGNFLILGRGFRHIYVPLPAIHIPAVRVVAAPYVRGKLLKAPVVDISRTAERSVVGAGIAVNSVKELRENGFAVAAVYAVRPGSAVRDDLGAPVLIDCPALFGEPYAAGAVCRLLRLAVVRPAVVVDFPKGILGIRGAAQPDRPLNLAVSDALGAGVFRLKSLLLLAGHSGCPQKGYGRVGPGAFPAVTAGSVRGVPVGGAVKIGLEGAEHGPQGQVIVQGIQVIHVRLVISPALFIPRLHQDQIEAVLVGEGFPAALHHKAPGIRSAGHADKYGGLVVNRALGNIKFGGADRILVHNTVKLIISVEKLSVVMLPVDKRLPGGGKPAGFRFLQIGFHK